MAVTSFAPKQASTTQEATSSPIKPVSKTVSLTPLLVEDHLTDVGNADRLVQCHGQDLRYCGPLGGWLVWDGRRWKTDGTNAVIKKAKETVRAMYLEAHETAAPRMRKDLAEHAIQSENVSRIRAMIALAESELPATPEEFDQDPWLFNMENGTLDLRTEELRAHLRADLITKIAPVRYDPKATCTRWDSFLKEILPDEEIRAFLQRAIGSCLTGIARDKAMFILWGGGDNGKSVFVETIRELVGDYAINASVETFLAKRSGGIPNDIARLRGARFVSAQESDQGRYLNEAMVKRMTGGDKETARFLNQEFFEFWPEYKPFLSTNHRPIIRGTDDAIWNRVKLIPVDVTIPKARQDRALRDKLRAELPGILNWALEGCREWKERGLDEPDAVHAATSNYRQEMDHLKDFLGECCVEDAEAKVTLKDLYAKYQDWCAATGEDAVKRRGFSARLRERGYRVEKGTDNKTFVFSLRLAIT